MRINRKHIIFRLIFIVVLIISIAICNIKLLPLNVIIGMFFLLYIMTMIVFATILESFKRLITSIETIFASTYFIYAIMNPIQYLLDDGKQRTWIFVQNDSIMEKTLSMYLTVYAIFIIIILFNNRPNVDTFEYVLNNLTTKEYKDSSRFNISDFGAFFCMILFLRSFIKNIASILTFVSFTSLRKDIQFTGQQYVWLYMMAYSITFLSGIPFEKNYFLKRINVIRLATVCMFWMMSSLIDRRHILPVFIAIALLLLATKKKITFKAIIPIVTIIFVFLLLAVIRLGYRVRALSFATLFYTMFGEFILTNYVSCYYVANPPTALLYGKTYLWNTITKLIPRVLFPGKPEDLALMFYKEAIRTGSGYAFNAIAEGIINFGDISVFITPFVIFFVMILGVKLCKKEPLYYFVVCAYSLDFLRGEFANSMFDLFVLYVFLVFMNRGRIKN